MDDFKKILDSISGATASTSTTTTPTTENSITKLLAERLTEQSKGISSSSSSNIKSAIDDAIKGTQESGNLRNAALESERQREVSFARDRAGATYTTALESRSGYATQVAGLMELTETTEKSIRDLDGRYKEAMLVNDADTAGQVATLRMQKLEFLQRQEEQFYSNLFTMASLEEQQTSRLQQESQFTRGMTAEDRRTKEKFGFDWAMFEKQTKQDERNMVLNLAAEYGVPVSDNESIESMIGKVSPFVDEKRALELQGMRTEIQRNQAEISRIAKGEMDEKPLTPDMIKALAIAQLSGNESLITGLKTPAQGAQVAAGVAQILKDNETILKTAAERTTNKEDFIKYVSSVPDAFVKQEDVDRYVSMYTPEWSTKLEKEAIKKSNESKQAAKDKKKGDIFTGSVLIDSTYNYLRTK